MAGEIPESFERTKPGETTSAGEKVQQVTSRIRGQSQEALQGLQETGQKAKQFASDYFEQGRQQAEELSRTVEHRIQDQPWSSIFVAVGLGFLVGLIFRRR